MIAAILLSISLCLCSFGEATERGIRNTPPDQECYSDACMQCHCVSPLENNNQLNDRKKRDEPSCSHDICGSHCGSIHYAHSYCSQWFQRVQAQWGAWAQWSSCTNTCGTGTHTRYRQCDNPPVKSQFDQPCVGDQDETQTCVTTCKVDGGWSDWKNVSSCSVTCGDGVYMRNRTCTNPPPQNGGLHCYGDESRLEKCSSSSPCVVDGGWSSWKVVSSCSTTCGQGVVLESRTCDNPLPLNGGQTCQGQHSRFTACNQSPCPIDGGWSAWKVVSSCSTTCGQGVVLESRTCDNPSPLNGGQTCQGQHSRFTACNQTACPTQPSTSTQQPVALTGSSAPSATGSTSAPTTITTGTPSTHGNIMQTFTLPAFPTKHVQTTGVMHTCNKYEVIHGLGLNNYVVHALANRCTSHGSYSPEAVVYKYCNVSHHSSWNKGQNIMDVCRNGISLQSYTAVSSFVGNTYNSSTDLAGVFVGCTTYGFKMAAQECGSRFEVLTINNLTSTRPIDNPDNYYVILA